MDRKEKLILADKLHKENRHEEALAILRELIAENENDHFAWWGIANVSSDLTERLEAVGRVMQLAPSFQKAYALREELEALIALDDPDMDEVPDMFEPEDEGIDTLLLDDVDEDALAEFRAAIDAYTTAAEDAQVDMDDIFDDMDFTPPPLELSAEEQAGIEAMGFDEIVEGIAADVEAPSEEASPSSQEEIFIEEHPTNPLPELDDVIAAPEDVSWMDAFAPRKLSSQLEEPAATWEEFFPTEDAEDAEVDADEHDLDEMLDATELEEVEVPEDDTFSDDDEADIDHEHLTAAATDDVPSPQQEMGQRIEVEDAENNLQETLIDLEIEKLARLDAELEEELERLAVEDDDFDLPVREVHEEDLVVRVSSEYRPPEFTRLEPPSPPEMNAPETHVVGEVMPNNTSRDLVALPEPLRPSSVTQFIQKNRIAIGVTVGLVAARVAWRLLSGGRK